MYKTSRSFDYNLVVYDEIESIQDYNSATFNYPYEARKNIISTFTFDISETNDYLNSFRIDDKKVNDTNERALQYKKFIGYIYGVKSSQEFFLFIYLLKYFFFLFYIAIPKSNFSDFYIKLATFSF